MSFELFPNPRSWSCLLITCFDIQERLFDQLSDTLTTLSSIPQTVASALPGYILCRAKPRLRELLQHYVVRENNNENN